MTTAVDSANSAPPVPVGVLIVDDQPPFRAVARTLVSLLKGWHVVGEVATGEDAVLAVGTTSPGIVLMDINLPGISGIEATRQITKAFPSVRVVLLSTYQADDLPADALSCGAAAYVRKEDLTPKVLREILLAA
ncbi:MAG: two-component system, NarL family, invasion response regulator UvrY [Pseudonocardiales bacterium]|jgi:two-component system invasion response regulator UvrY|nr:response regulator receiver protein [Pseudonocardiales bacterium]MDT4909774.1 two-component system, NarL family, invasion response regulator UvrY [Pseudonocardiales bacterium]MDT4959753.1 two-component system, NarL family, invasion response regulator UvrY [Pseudonocardiales bacterium]MDT4964318.1 two-component system, NarL family, invasion response regulator UvrY [Pseudonocardiales bacterium]MDT4969866.1 two-component system, NarL family, invasion response regulator UvrY [Pseudonocardiales b